MITAGIARSTVIRPILMRDHFSFRFRSHFIRAESGPWAGHAITIELRLPPPRDPIRMAHAGGLPVS